MLTKTHQDLIDIIETEIPTIKFFYKQRLLKNAENENFEDLLIEAAEKFEFLNVIVESIQDLDENDCLEILTAHNQVVSDPNTNQSVPFYNITLTLLKRQIEMEQGIEEEF